MLCDLVSSDCFILLHKQKNKENNKVSDDEESETVQEYLSTKISLAVYKHIKQYKTPFKEVDVGPLK